MALWNQKEQMLQWQNEEHGKIVLDRHAKVPFPELRAEFPGLRLYQNIQEQIGSNSGNMEDDMEKLKMLT